MVVPQYDDDMAVMNRRKALGPSDGTPSHLQKQSMLAITSHIGTRFHTL
jgi:hypothetical protein